MWLTKRDTTVPAPFIVAPSGKFEGSDGNWSTFSLSAGTPPQQFHVTISTLSSAVWLPQGCDQIDQLAQLGVSESQCAQLRGIQLVNGGTNPGFQDNQSSTWQGDGSQELALTSQLPSNHEHMDQVYGAIYNLSALYGQDTVALSAQSGDATVSAVDAPIAGIVDPYEFTLGSLGLAFGDINVGGTSSKTFTEILANTSSIPSRSWSYTAGAVYQSNGVAGSLILGGYDERRIKGDNATIEMPATTETSLLQVRVKGITMAFGNNSDVSLTADSNSQASPFDAILDFTLPYLYLPDSIVDSLQASMGLAYNNQSDIYFWNGTQSDLGVTSFTFDLTDTQGGSNKTSITLPWNALNLTASWPNSPTTVIFNYFPIRKAPDKSTFILGRSFFQEAFVIADFERQSFTVGQAAFPTTADTQIVTIYNTTFGQNNNHGGGGGGLSGGAIAGIVIAVILGVAFLALAFWLWRRRKRQAGKQNSAVHAAAYKSAEEEKLGQQANRDRSDTVLSDQTAGSYELGAMPLGHRPSHHRHVSELSSDSETTMAAKVRSPSTVYEMPDTSLATEFERDRLLRSSSPAVEAPTREASTRTATTAAAPSPMLTAASPALSSREPLSGVAEVVSPDSPAPARQLSVTPVRGVSKFSERSSDMQP